MSFVVITGIDKSGKSTLSRELSKRLYYPVINRLLPKQNIFIECIDTLTHYSEPYIIERFHIDEQVYGPVKRGKSRFDLRQYKLIDLYMLALGTFNIYCTDTREKIAERFVKDKEEYIQLDELNAIYNSYEQAIKDSSLTWHEYRIGDSIDELAEKIKKHMSNELFKRAHEAQKTKTIGNYDAEIMFVGEKYGDRHLPPMIPFGNNEPGLNFFKALNHIYPTVFDWKNMILTNAFKFGLTEKENREALEAELSRPNLKKVICLGDNANDYVKQVASVLFQPNLFNTEKKSPIIKKVTHPSGFFVYQGGVIEEYANFLAETIKHE